MQKLEAIMKMITEKVANGMSVAIFYRLIGTFFTLLPYAGLIALGVTYKTRFFFFLAFISPAFYLLMTFRVYTAIGEDKALI